MLLAGVAGGLASDGADDGEGMRADAVGFYAFQAVGRYEFVEVEVVVPVEQGVGDVGSVAELAAISGPGGGGWFRHCEGE